MKTEASLCAVITGDIVKSSEVKYEDRETVLAYLHDCFEFIEDQLHLHDAILLPFEIFRGDSFQIVLTRPDISLLASIILSLKLMTFDSTVAHLTARISIGIGTIDYIPDSKNAGEADGMAFRLSGKNLDRMKQKDQNLLITTPNPALNLIFEAECAFFDHIANRWTDIQKEVLLQKLSGSTQEEIASRHGKSQSTISQSLKAAGFDVVREFISSYEELFKYSDIFCKK